MYSRASLYNFCEENKLRLIKDYSTININRDTRINVECITCNYVWTEKSFKALVGRKKLECMCHGSTKIRYNKFFLYKFCEENNLRLIKDYSTININRATRINAECITCKDVLAEKSFLSLVNRNFECLCHGSSIHRYDKKFLHKFCQENNIILTKNYDKVTCETLLAAKCIDCQKDMDEKTFHRFVNGKNFRCKECAKDIINEKREHTNLLKYDCKFPQQTQKVKDKVKVSCIEKYGVEYVQQNKEIRQKVNNTCLEKYGVEHVFQNKEVKQKIKDKCIKIYGCEYVSQNQEIKQKIKDTCLLKYGCENVFQNTEIKQIMKNTMLINHGCEYSMQK